MKFEFAVSPAFNFLTAFAEEFNVPVFKNSVSVPTSMGKGFIKKIDIEPCFKLVIHHYTLAQDFHLKRMPSSDPSDLISIVFNSNEIPTGPIEDTQEALQFFKKNNSVIQIASSILGTETSFPKNSEVFFAVVGIKAPVLASILKIEKTNSLVEKILSGNTPFFFHENMSVDETKILEQLFKINDHEELSNFYYRIKIEELLYLLFSKLLARESAQMTAINKSDIDKLYAIRTAIIADISMQPKLNELAKMAGMSETKMKQLFKQIFGDTIYNYYQKERMDEAAFLIKRAGYSVSEAGYHLGFSNLSHFSRLFEKHHGNTPKKYSYTG
ncbi:MAG TPA: AraC family transcriptional regulator [Pedobacter sp.]